jgi:hypothetical protein
MRRGMETTERFLRSLPQSLRLTSLGKSKRGHIT